ncbi:hypothetical protein DFP85_10162 [Halomonas ventosae]|uniref:Capsular biosynthesis protein n=1 Tax=Halomonas ventosae TaxID=229007 RepID=A0A4R6ZWH8_9GAMM|nr:capsular biosynthesis protein [Halomonas ventosae]TDR57247.1 hypothetical protein DFP85_10162 [Halomonas ventosae]
MFLIMSAAYISQELRSEFGALPPSFLPLGNRRLFQYQISLAPKGAQIFLTLPESFVIPDFDNEWLLKNGITIVKLPDGLSLGASLVTALNLVDQGLEVPLHVLFGDTVIDPLPHGQDLVAIATVEDNYDWAVVTEDDDNWLVSSQNILAEQEHSVITGYFKFSNPRQLIRCITKYSWQFLKGLGCYRQKIGLSEVPVSNWLDFGHANTYYRSKSAYTTQRIFNDLKITSDWIEKSGIHNEKIEAEANWFENIPPMIRRYTPQYLGRPGGIPSGAYRLEYLHHIPLNELYVFADVAPLLWKKILKECLAFLKCCSNYPSPDGKLESGVNLDAMFTEKTTARLRTFSLECGFRTDTVFRYHTQDTERRTLELSINDIVQGSEAQLPSGDAQSTLVHGDFCFSNVLYEFRTNRIKVIDPRGLTPAGEKCIFGDIRYDLAKLSHSVLGMYDWIVAGYHETSFEGQEISIALPETSKHHEIQKMFLDMIEAEYSVSPAQLYAMQVHLFLSMLPLHNDDVNRQYALLANSFRLYNLMERHQQ